LLREPAAFSKNEAVFLRAEVTAWNRLIQQWAGLNCRTWTISVINNAQHRDRNRSHQDSLDFDIFQTHRQFADALAGRMKDGIADCRVGSDIGQFAQALYARRVDVVIHFGK